MFNAGAVWEYWVFRKTLFYLSVRDCVNIHLLNNLATAKSGCDEIIKELGNHD